MDICKICTSQLGDELTVRLQEKGVQGILESAKKRESELTVNVGDLVHTKCRKSYVNKKAIERQILKLQQLRETGSTSSAESISLKRKLRSENEPSPFNTQI